MKKKRHPGTYNVFGKKFNIEVKCGKVTRFGNDLNLYLKDNKDPYKLVPQVNVFICFSGNTSDEVLRVQNELLIRNLYPNQKIEWIPIAWNAIPEINAFGTDKTAQQIINTSISEADYIFFVIKDIIGKGIKEEWEIFGKHPNGKGVYLCIFDNDNTQKIHEELDPLNQIVYSPYKDYKDILLKIRDIEYAQLDLLKLGDKLKFVRTREQLVDIQNILINQLKELKQNNGDQNIIFKIKNLKEYIDKNGDNIINKKFRHNSVLSSVMGKHDVSNLKLNDTRAVSLSPNLRDRRIEVNINKRHLK